MRYIQTAVGAGAQYLEQLAATLVPQSKDGQETPDRSPSEGRELEQSNVCPMFLRSEMGVNPVHCSSREEPERIGVRYAVPQRDRRSTSSWLIRDKRRFYAVAIGIRTGIFHSWEAYRPYVDGFPNATHQRFGTAQEAEEYLRGYGVDPVYHNE